MTTLKVKAKNGIHARPASVMVATASKFSSKVMIKYGEKELNAKSVMSLMTAGITDGDEITIMAEGEDANLAEQAMLEILQAELD